MADICRCDWCKIASIRADLARVTREREDLERRLKKAEEVVLMARQLTAYAWEDRLEDCAVSDSAKRDLRELSTAIWLYDQEAAVRDHLAAVERDETKGGVT